MGQKCRGKWVKNYKDIWDELTYEQKLAATRFIFEKICEHARHSGSYRYLIYDRLGFSSDAYSELYPEGMLISNGFILREEDDD